MPSPQDSLVVSVVSHGQAALVGSLLADLERFTQPAHEIVVVLTLNIPEKLPFKASDFSFRLDVVRNAVPKGFAANHNAAFRHVRGQCFCVLNPDIRLVDDPFPELLALLQQPSTGLAAPRIIDQEGRAQDSARPLPTPWAILKKAVGYCAGRDTSIPSPLQMEWVAGMFMCFRAETYAALHGFDERYFLYYEDVDLCCRLRLAGYRIRICDKSVAVHEARRTSHRSFRYLRWHLASITRFFLSAVFFRTLLLRYRSRAPV